MTEYHIEPKYPAGQAGGLYWGRWPRVLPPTLIVIHSTRSGILGWPDNLELSSTLNHFHNGAAGAHAVVNAAGDIYWIVPLEWCAWGAAYLNPFALHIELTQPTINTPFESGHYTGCAEAIRQIREIYPSIPLIHVSSEEYSGIIGHAETAQGRDAAKSDPGYKFSFEKLLGMLGEDMPAEQTPSIIDSLNLIWAKLSEIQDKAGPGEITDLAEEAKQSGVVEIKKSIGI